MNPDSTLAISTRNALFPAYRSATSLKHKSVERESWTGGTGGAFGVNDLGWSQDEGDQEEAVGAGQCRHGGAREVCALSHG